MMGHSYRAGYGTDHGVNPEHTSKPPERTLRAPVEEYREKGPAFPYRGTEQHGVAVPSDIEIEDEHQQQRTPELVLPPHELAPPRKPEPVPVKVVKHGGFMRHATDQFILPDIGSNPALQVMGRQLNRKVAYIYNMDPTNPIYIGYEAELTPREGFPIPAKTSSFRLYTQDAIYLCADPGNTPTVAVYWEYEV